MTFGLHFEIKFHAFVSQFLEGSSETKLNFKTTLQHKNKILWNYMASKLDYCEKKIYKKIIETD